MTDDDTTQQRDQVHSTEDADKLAQPDFPPSLVPQEEGESGVTTDESRAKAKDPQHGGE